jgi:F0F1-type ATP synthase assembly protein I
MMQQKQKGITKNEMAYIFAIILGLIIGVLIKRVRVGVMIGLVLCVLIGLSSIMRFMRNK